MNGFWVISDTHFFHENIIEYAERPFKSVEEMNNHMISKWNEVISPEDTIYHLGDFAMGKENVAELVTQLNGKIILILGNHDRKGKQWFREQGFVDAVKEVSIGKFLLTHRPKREGLPDGMINIHGHMHGKTANLDKDIYMDYSVECTNYAPAWIKLDKS